MYNRAPASCIHQKQLPAAGIHSRLPYDSNCHKKRVLQQAANCGTIPHPCTVRWLSAPCSLFAVRRYQTPSCGWHAKYQHTRDTPPLMLSCQILTHKGHAPPPSCGCHVTYTATAASAMRPKKTGALCETKNKPKPHT